MRHFLWVLIICLITLGCKLERKRNKKGVFFGGQVVQPTSDYLTLYQGNNTIDTLYLDVNQRFEKQFDSLMPDLYKLEHVPEFQNVLFEKGDSLWVRFNATTMKESLVYSGTGAAKNNFLMGLTLDQERENRFLSNKYSLSSQDFNELIDSLLIEKKTRWMKMDSLSTLSPVAQKITQAAYIYSYATIRERYALFRGTTWSKEERNIFFDFRKYLNLGDTDLAFFDPYINYLLNYVNNEALESGQNYIQQKPSTTYSINKLKVVDEDIKGSLLRNNLARAIAFEEILRFENHEAHDLFLQFYATVNSSPSYFSEVISFHNDITRMKKGEKIASIQLQTTEGDNISSDALWDDRPTVIYFWSQNKMGHYKNTIKKLESLQVKFSNYRFVGICLQPFNEVVDQVQQMMQVVSEDQFALLDYERASQVWMLTLLNKAIILEPKGILKEPFGNFLDPEFETLLERN